MSVRKRRNVLPLKGGTIGQKFSMLTVNVSIRIRRVFSSKDSKSA
jgi:hypothetical protein